MSFADQTFDSFDGDESLLVSPAVNRSRARDSNSNERNINERSNDRQFGSEEHDNSNQGPNDDSLETSTSTMAADESFLADRTPIKASKFNYAFAMEELECLAPTPATNKKTGRPGRLFAAPGVVESPTTGSAESTIAQRQMASPGVAESLSLVGRASFSPPLSPTVGPPFDNTTSSFLANANEASMSYTAPTVDAAPASAFLASSPQSQAEVGRPAAAEAAPAAAKRTSSPYFSSAAATGNNASSSLATSVFRHPCIRASNSNESPSLELKLGYPVKSYDSNECQLLHSTGEDDATNEHMVNHADLSMEVEKDADENENFLAEDSRVDNVDMADIGVEVATSEPVEHLGEAEEFNGSHHDGSLGENAGVDESTEQLNVEEEFSGSHRDYSLEENALEDGEIGEEQLGALDDVNVSIDLAITAGRVSRRGPKFHPPLDGQSTSGDFSDPFQAARNQNNDSLDNSGAAAWDCMDSDDSEEDTETKQKSDYVDKMRESMASYFSCHSGSTPEDGDCNNDSLESSNLDGSLNDSVGAAFQKQQQLLHGEGDVSQETHESTSYSEEAYYDENEGMVNLSALGDDASQIDVAETLEYVGHVQSIQYQRYENVLGELNDKLQDNAGTMGLEGDEAQNNSESLDDSQDFSVDGVKEDDPIDDSSFLPNVDQDKLENSDESEPTSIATETSYYSENNDTQSTIEAQQPVEDKFAPTSSNDLSGTSFESHKAYATAEDAASPMKLPKDTNSCDLEEEIESESTPNASFSPEKNDAQFEDQFAPTTSGDLVDTSSESNTCHPAPEIESKPIAGTRETAEGFCDSVIKSSIVGITSNALAKNASKGSQLALGHETKAPPRQPFETRNEMESSFEEIPSSFEENHDSLVTQATSHDLQVSSPPPEETEKVEVNTHVTARRRSRPSLLKAPLDNDKEAPLLGTDDLSPISKSSSPHSSCDLPTGTQHTNGNRIDNSAHAGSGGNCLPAILDTFQSLSRQSGEVIVEQTRDYATGISDEVKNGFDQDDERNLVPTITSSEQPNRSNEATSSSGGSTGRKTSIFQVLSQQPVQERSPIKESAPDDIPTEDHSPEDDVEQPVSHQESVNNQEHSPGSSDREQPIAHKGDVDNYNCNESSFGTKKAASPPETSFDVDDFNNTPESQGKRKSLEDLSSYQKNFNSTSSAFLERLRGAAENRKREVTRGRHSMERKEQILYEEKKVRAQMPLPSVDEDTMEEPRRKSVVNRPKKKIDGLDPYKPFRAVGPRASTIHAPKKTTAVSQRKSLAPGENPYIAFRARPMPGSSRSSSMSLGGAKRKSSHAFRPHPAQNKSYVKSSALDAKPPKRLLSGEDASIAKEMSRKKRLQEEEAKIRRESAFKARPLPATTLARNQGPLAGEDLVPAKTRIGKENSSSAAFIPRSTFRAEERASYDAEKERCMEEHRQFQIDKRNQLISDKTEEIKDLKKFIR